MKIRKIGQALTLLAVASSVAAVQPSVTEAAITANNTIFGPNVYVFDPSMPAADIQATANTIFTAQESSEFSSARYAMLFKPGTYNVNFNVGFYTSVAGLGVNPDDVNITGGLNANADWDNGNATRNFWRSVENLKVTPSSGKTQYAVSQAAPMRRVHIAGGLDLFDFDNNWNAGWASGGFLADSVVDGAVVPASQQQWFSRNSQWGSWSNGVWNMVFVGSNNTPTGQFPDPPYTVVDKTPVIREKPYLYANSAGQYQVFVPALQTDTKGVSWLGGATPGQSIGIDQFYIAKPDTSNAAAINAALSQGKHLLFTPGIYHLNDTIRITNPNTVVLGIGLPTLVPDTGLSTMTVADVDGVKIAGLMFDAGPQNSPTLLQVGPAGSSANHAANPTSLHDLYFRTGGAIAGRNDVSLMINSNHVIGDHFWLWRADHGAGASWTTNVSKNGLVVNGSNVTIYGLFNEHHNEYQTLWNGNEGRVYFYQSEIPYDVPNQSSWMSQNGTVNGYASYKVANSVTNHEVWGLGIYSYFRDAAVKLNSAIEVPDVQGVKIHHATTVWLNGVAGSEITYLINNIGGRVYANTTAAAMRQTITEFAGTGTGNGGGGGGSTALSRTGWTATSSTTSGDVPANMLDGSAASRWSSGAAMTNGQYVVIDMKAAQSFNRIVMDSTASASDYARGYQVFVSNDGTNWGNAITTGTGTGAVVSVDLPAQNARYIKIVQTGSASSWWSIHELNVYGSGSVATGTVYDRTGWTATSTPSSGDVPANMLDGSAASRWSSGAPMASGQYWILDMKSSRSISKLIMDSTGSANDYARGYQVFVSSDGTNWGTAVASGTGTGAVVTVNLSVASARYIKVVQTGTASSWWSIHELNVYS